MRIAIALILTAATACSDSAAYDAQIDPSRFGAGVDNAYFPLVPGTVFRYEVQETGEQVTVTVTDRTRTVMDVVCVEVHDEAEVDGMLAEDTYDWYAQDVDDNVWYFGEDTTAYEDGGTSKEGSWEGGVDGAQPGRIILGDPAIGEPYRQEYRAGEAEDYGEVLALDVSVTVPAGSYSGCMQTRDYSALEPDVEENKLYCPGTGQVKTIATKGDPETEVLISVTAP